MYGVCIKRTHTSRRLDMPVKVYTTPEGVMREVFVYECDVYAEVNCFRTAHKRSSSLELSHTNALHFTFARKNINVHTSPLSSSFSLCVWRILCVKSIRALEYTVFYVYSIVFGALYPQQRSRVHSHTIVLPFVSLHIYTYNMYRWFGFTVHSNTIRTKNTCNTTYILQTCTKTLHSSTIERRIHNERRGY